MKKTALWIVLDLIFLIIFNAVFFIVGGAEHNIAVWISYGFIHFAYLMLLITPILIRKSKSAAVFGFSLYAVSSTYFVVELITGITFILIAPDGYKIASLVQLCIACFYCVLLISNILANEYTAESEEIKKYGIEYIKCSSSKIKILIDRISDKEIKKKVERVYDAFYSSPVKSHQNLAEIENNLLLYVNELEEAVSSGNTDRINLLVDSLLAAINERNIQLKMLS